MILHHSRARFDFNAMPHRRASRLRIGTVMLASMVAVLSVLNVVVGTA